MSCRIRNSGRKEVRALSNDAWCLLQREKEVAVTTVLLLHGSVEYGGRAKSF